MSGTRTIQASNLKSRNPRRVWRIETGKIREASVWVRSDAEADFLKPRRGEQMDKIEVALFGRVVGRVIMLGGRTKTGERREIERVFLF